MSDNYKQTTTDIIELFCMIDIHIYNLCHAFKLRMSIMQKNTKFYFVANVMYNS